MSGQADNTVITQVALTHILDCAARRDFGSTNVHGHTATQVDGAQSQVVVSSSKTLVVTVAGGNAERQAVTSERSGFCYFILRVATTTEGAVQAALFPLVRLLSTTTQFIDSVVL